VSGASKSRLGRVLALVAAALAFTAAIIHYVRGQEIDYTSIGGGVFMLVLAFTLGKRR
jgi:hypothetical protein